MNFQKKYDYKNKILFYFYNIIISLLRKIENKKIVFLIELYYRYPRAQCEQLYAASAASAVYIAV